MRARWAAIVVVSFVALAAPIAAQPASPPIADPHHAYRVAGRVVFADGQAAAGLTVERATSRSDLRPFSAGAYAEHTDAAGAFVFEFSGLGVSTGREWTLVVRRAGCAPGVATVTLRDGELGGWHAEVASGVGITLPACASDPAPVPMVPGTS